MSRTVYVYDRQADKVVEKHQRPVTPGGPFVISDTMDALAHPCTGKLMDSKSQFRRVTRQHGCEEVGSSPFPKRQEARPDVGSDLRRALQQHGL